MLSTGAMPGLQQVMGTLAEARKRGATIDEALSRFSGKISSYLVSRVVASTSNVSEARRFFDWSCRQGGFRNDSIAYTTMLQQLVKNDRFGEALAFFNRELLANCRPNLFTFTVLIRGFCKQGELRKAWSYLEQMKNSNLVPDATTFNILLKGYCDSGRYKRVLSRFGDMAEVWGCKPDVITYNTVIHGLCRLGKIDWAAFVFERMTGAEGISYSYEGDKSIVLNREMFKRLPQDLVEPDKFTYSTMIHGLCQAERMDDAVKVFDMMLQKNQDGDAGVYNAMADGLCKERRVEEALRLVKIMMHRGCRPSIVTYNTIITGVCLSKERIREAYELFKQMIGSDCPPNVITYSTMIYGLARIYRASECVKLLRSMPKNGISPDEYTYHAVIYAFVRIRQLRTAKLFFIEAANTVGPSVHMYTTLISGYCRAAGGPRTTEALILFKNMKDRRCWPNVITYNCLLRGLCKQGEFEKAYEIFQEMFTVKCHPNRMTFKIMLDGMIRTKNTEKFEKIFMDMVYKGRWQGEGPLLEQHGLIDVIEEERREFFVKTAASKEPGNPVETLLKGQYY